jgi:hypothetical protein
VILKSSNEFVIFRFLDLHIEHLISVPYKNHFFLKHESLLDFVVFQGMALSMGDKINLSQKTLPKGH